jgi:hypothetical protein
VAALRLNMWRTVLQRIKNLGAVLGADEEANLSSKGEIEEHMHAS